MIKTKEEFKNNPSEVFKQLENCKYKCEGGALEHNTTYIALKELLLLSDKNN